MVVNPPGQVAVILIRNVRVNRILPGVRRRRIPAALSNLKLETRSFLNPLSFVLILHDSGYNLHSFAPPHARFGHSRSALQWETKLWDPFQAPSPTIYPGRLLRRRGWKPELPRDATCDLYSPRQGTR